MIDYCEEDELRQSIKRAWLEDIKRRERELEARAQLWDYVHIVLIAVMFAATVWAAWWIGAVAK